jgi:hypothetical protein
LGFYSTFIPMPNTTYNIQPRPIFGILLGDFQPRSNFDRPTDEICEVDFDQLGTDDVEVVHTDRNELVIVTNALAYGQIGF